MVVEAAPWDNHKAEWDPQGHSVEVDNCEIPQDPQEVCSRNWAENAQVVLKDTLARDVLVVQSGECLGIQGPGCSGQSSWEYAQAM